MILTPRQPYLANSTNHSQCSSQLGVFLRSSAKLAMTGVIVLFVKSEVFARQRESSCKIFKVRQLLLNSSEIRNHDRQAPVPRVHRKSSNSIWCQHFQSITMDIITFNYYQRIMKLPKIPKYLSQKANPLKPIINLETNLIQDDLINLSCYSRPKPQRPKSCITQHETFQFRGRDVNS